VVVDGSRALDSDARAILEATRARARIVLFNKSDLGLAGYAARARDERDAVAGSVRDAETLAALRAEIARAGWGSERIDVARPHLASARQANALARAREALDRAQETLRAGDALDLIAPELLAAVAALGEITGAVATEAILDGVFARFCIGK